VARWLISSGLPELAKVMQALSKKLSKTWLEI